MNECPGELQKEHIREISALRVDVDMIKDKVDDLSDMKDAVTRLATIQERQAEREIKFDKIYEDQIKVNAETHLILKNINQSLVSMNSELKETNIQVASLKTEVCTLKNENEAKAEDKKNKTEVIKSRIAFYGSIIGTLGLIVVAIIK